MRLHLTQGKSESALLYSSSRLSILPIAINPRPWSILPAEVVEEEGFDDMLQGVRDRVDEIESLHRTRELTVSRIFDTIGLLVRLGRVAFCF